MAWTLSEGGGVRQRIEMTEADQVRKERRDFELALRAWLMQVASDPDATKFKILIAHILAFDMNRVRGWAWPTQETIAGRAKGTEQGVQGALSWLEDRGHLKREKIGRANRYQPISKSTNGRWSIPNTESTNGGTSERPTAAQMKDQPPLPQNLEGTAMNHERAPRARALVLGESQKLARSDERQLTDTKAKSYRDEEEIPF